MYNPSKANIYIYVIKIKKTLQNRNVTVVTVTVFAATKIVNPHIITIKSFLSNYLFKDKEEFWNQNLNHSFIITLGSGECG